MPGNFRSPSPDTSPAHRPASHRPPPVRRPSISPTSSARRHNRPGAGTIRSARRASPLMRHAPCERIPDPPDTTCGRHAISLNEGVEMKSRLLLTTVVASLVAVGGLASAQETYRTAQPPMQGADTGPDDGTTRHAAGRQRASPGHRQQLVRRRSIDAQCDGQHGVEAMHPRPELRYFLWPVMHREKENPARTFRHGGFSLSIAKTE